MKGGLGNFGIRSKLIVLFVAIKVIPLILLALLAWRGITGLDQNVAVLADSWSAELRALANSLGKNFAKEAERALNDRAREELERLTTDTARAVADFLNSRDSDILLAAQLAPDESVYRAFVANRTRGMVDSGSWKLAADGRSWVPTTGPGALAPSVHSSNPENSQDFHYRQPESVLRTVQRPLYHEITFVGLDGQEKIKVSTGSVLPRALGNVSQKQNTYCRAETYFAEIAKLKPGQIWVSEVIGPYVGSHIIGAVTPDSARNRGLPFAPDKEAYAGRENPLGKRFQGIVRWATPVARGGKVVGYVTLALDHAHLMSFTDNLLPNAERYTAIPDAANGNYAFMWDNFDRAISHPRHHSIIGFDPDTGEYAIPWLPSDIYDGWKQSGLQLTQYLSKVPAFDRQSRERKPAKASILAGMLGLDCRYLNFAPQCQGWHDLTEHGGSGSFLINWSGVWKLTTAATIPYFTGRYGKSRRGFGYVTIGANIDDFKRPALESANKINSQVGEFTQRIQTEQGVLHSKLGESVAGIVGNLTVATLLMVFVVIVVAIWLASVLTRRITYLTSGLQRIEQGDFGYRLQRTSDDEIGKLTDSLNRMSDSVQASFKRLEEIQLDTLQKSEEQHRQVVDNASEGIVVIQDERIAFSNPMFARMSGRQQGDLPGVALSELLHPGDRERLDGMTGNLQANAAMAATRFEARLLAQDGESRWIELSVVPIAWLDRPAVLAFITDINERRRLEDNLTEVLRERETILEHAVVGIAFVDPAGRPKWANQAMGKIFGIDPAKVMEESLEPYFHSPEDYQAVGRSINEAIRRQEVFTREMSLRRADGSAFWAHVSGKAVSVADLSQGTVWVVTDISSRRALEEQLLRTTTEWKIILESALIGITYTNDRILRFANRTFAEMVGYEPEELIGQSSLIYYPDEESWRQTGEVAYPILQKEEAFAGERRLRRKNGEIFWVQIYGKSIVQGQPEKGVIWTMIDISERRKAEADILKAVERQRELNELRSRFVSMTSHEFRTPLATILSSAELLLYYGERLPKEEKDEILGSIDAAVGRMTRMLDSILIIGRADAGQMEFHPEALLIEPFCRGLLEEAANEAKQAGRTTMDFQFRCDGANAPLLLDEKLLRHVLGNLLSNAFKYSPAGQPVQFDVEECGTELRFRIADQGIGIPEEHLPQLFETFHRARNVGSISGTGLGMAIVKRALELHGGHIQVESAVGCGSTFTVTLPRHIVG